MKSGSWFSALIRVNLGFVTITYISIERKAIGIVILEIYSVSFLSFELI